MIKSNDIVPERLFKRSSTEVEGIACSFPFLRLIEFSVSGSWTRLARRPRLTLFFSFLGGMGKDFVNYTKKELDKPSLFSQKFVYLYIK
jgi:hypothetical protein